MKYEKLLKKIKTYALIKYTGICLGLIVSLVGGFIFFGCVICSMFDLKNDFLVKYAGAAMILGLFFAFVCAAFIEKIANRLMNNSYKSFLECLVFGLKEDLGKDILYYDFIDIFIKKIKRDFYSYSTNQDELRIANFLKIIMIDTNIIGLANQFVYRNRKKFVEICKEILNKYDNWDNQDVAELWEIYDKNKECVDDATVTVFKEKKKENIRKLIIFSKVCFVILCSITFIFQLIFYNNDPISLVFNFVAVLLIIFDLIEKKI